MVDSYAVQTLQGAVAAIISGRLDLLDAVQGDQLCHMRAVVGVISAKSFQEHLNKRGELQQAKDAAARWLRFNVDAKFPDGAHFHEFAGYVETCLVYLGARRMEILQLCFDTTRDVTWVYNPMGMSIYFRDQGKVQSKAGKQKRLQELCILEFETFVDSLHNSKQSGSFLNQLKQALKVMRKRITEGGRDIPVLDFFIATITAFIMNFMETNHSIFISRRIMVSPPINDDSPGGEAVSLEEIILQVFKHDRETGQHKLIDVAELDEFAMETPMLLIQAWSKYTPEICDSGINSSSHTEYAGALGQRVNELIVRYLTKHPSYAETVAHDIGETEDALKEISRHGPLHCSDDAIAKFSFNPFGENTSLIDIWRQASVHIEGLGAGENKPHTAIARGRIYKEATKPVGWNIDHIMGATPRQVLQWRKNVLCAHKQAGNPKFGLYMVVAGSSALPCYTESCAREVAENKDKKRKKDFLIAHSQLTPVVGHTSWAAAFIPI